MSDITRNTSYRKYLKYKLKMLAKEFEMARMSLEGSINDEHEKMAICWLRQISERKRIICREIRRLKKRRIDI